MYIHALRNSYNFDMNNWITFAQFNAENYNQVFKWGKILETHRELIEQLQIVYKHPMPDLCITDTGIYTFIFN